MFVSSVARRSTRSLVRYQLQKKIHFHSSVCNHSKLIQNSSYQYTFSTIPLDGSGSSAFLSSSNSNDTASVQAESSSTESIYSQSPSLEQPQSSTLSTLQFQQQIQQWMAVNPRIAPYKAEELLSKLWVEQQEIFSNHGAPTTAIQPDIILTTELVNLVLQSWCFSNNGQVSAERAERLLHWMEDLHTSQSSLEWSYLLPKPNYQSYATVIDAWFRAAVYESNNPTSTTDEIETKSRGRTKSNVISSATKAGFDCAKNAEDVLMHMQRMHEEQAQVEGYNSEIQPDTRVFNLVLEAWSKIKGGTKASATRAMRILDLMQELHFQSANDSWQGVVLSKVQPNLQTYKLVLYAWAHATHTVEGPDRAEEILRHLLSMSKAGNLGAEILPDAVCFHIVMKANADSVRKRGKGDDGLASVERAHKVSDLLEWMEMLAVRSKVQPTTESYRIAISAWVWSHHVDAPIEAEKILNRMIRVHDMHQNTATDARSSTKLKKSKPQVLPSTQDFNTIINCCSYARRVGIDKSEEDDESLALRQIEHKEIYDIAERVFKTLIASTYAQPDSATFSGIIRACNNLLPNTDERDDIVIEYFRLAYHTNPPTEDTSTKISSTSRDRMAPPPGGGCVDANVLRQLRSALPSTELYIQVRENFEQYRRHNSKEE